MSRSRNVPRRAAREVDYVRWQNRATRFYLAARHLWFKELYSAAAFSGQHAIEVLLKATLVYHDRSFQPEAANHNWPKMIRMLGNKGARGKHLTLPEYFYADGRFQAVSRYPRDRDGLAIPNSFLADLDRGFAELVALVPFQFNAELIHLLEQPSSAHARILSRGNRQMRAIRKSLRGWVRPREKRARRAGAWRRRLSREISVDDAAEAIAGLL